MKGRIRAAAWFRYTRYIHPFCKFDKFQPSRPHRSWEKCDETFSCLKIGEKEKWRIKGHISSSSLIPVYTIHLPTVHVCTKFQPSRPHSSWEKCDKKIYVWKFERKKKEKLKGRIRAATWFWETRYIHHFSTCVTSFNLLGLTVQEKIVTKIFNVWKLERKENEEIKAQICNSSLIPVYTIHLSIVHVCTKFQSSRSHSSWEKCDKNFNIWKLERKKIEEIKVRIISSSLIPVHTIHLPIVHMCTKFQPSRPYSSWEKCDETF